MNYIDTCTTFVITITLMVQMLHIKATWKGRMLKLPKHQDYILKVHSQKCIDAMRLAEKN